MVSNHGNTKESRNKDGAGNVFLRRGFNMKKKVVSLLCMVMVLTFVSGSSKTVYASQDSLGKYIISLLTPTSSSKSNTDVNVDNGEYYILSELGKYIDINRASKDKNAPAILFDYNGNNNQIFALERKGDSYKIIAKHSGLALTVKDNSKKSSTSIVQAEYREGNDYQLWYVYQSGKGCKFVNKATKMCIDVEGAKSNNNTRIQQYKDNSTNAQIFHLVSVKKAFEATIEDFTKLPTKHIYGTTFSLTGTITANKLLKEVSVVITNSDGSKEIEETITNIDSSIFNMKEIDPKVRFKTLSTGDKEISIIATDYDGQRIYVNTCSFKVVIDVTGADGDYKLSGTYWVKQFMPSTSLDDLKGDFKDNAKKFVKELENKGYSIKINTTYRPHERIYLMYYAWLIAHKSIEPEKVPPMDGVRINWVHPTREASIKAAQEMIGPSSKGGYGMIKNTSIDPISNHAKGTAMDIEISKNGKLLKDKDGLKEAIEIGSKYNVKWYGSGDYVHWSVTGR